MLTVDICDDPERWDAYIAAAPEASNYHRWGWKQVVEAACAWPTFYLVAQESGGIRGVLPLVWQKSFLFGSFLTSLPFFTHGGVVADDAEAERALLNRAIGYVRDLPAHHLELRHQRAHALGLTTRCNKVSVVSEVDPDEEKALRSLRHEVRTKIRKALKAGLTADICDASALDEFYDIFAANMRDLGTPVFSKRFFREIFRVFPSDAFVCVVRHLGKAVAASLMTGFRDTLETVWGASLQSYLHMAPNMLMYWRMMRFAAERGFRVFDFGRSTVNSGPHRFKLQWSSQQVPLCWQYWVPGNGRLPELSPSNPKYRLAIRLWQNLPVAVTKFVGPPIVRCLP